MDSKKTDIISVGTYFQLEPVPDLGYKCEQDTAGPQGAHSPPSGC